MRGRTLWTSVLAIAVLAAGFAIGAALRDGERSETTAAAVGHTDENAVSPAVSGDSEHSHDEHDHGPVGVPAVPSSELQDGRGNELLPWGSAPGGAWYCEANGIAEEGIVEPPPPGAEPDSSSPRELVERTLRVSNLQAEPADFVGAFEARLGSGDEIAGLSADFLDRRPDDVLDLLPGAAESTLRLSVAIDDPQRLETRTAGVVVLELYPDFGWAVTNTGFCSSALRGEFIPYEPLSEEEKARLEAEIAAHEHEEEGQ